MKKLIISMVATASIALVAKADTVAPNATSFENYVAEKFSVGLNDSGSQGGELYWSGGAEGQFEFIEVDAEAKTFRPKYWDGTTPDAKALSIDTDKALSRNVAPSGAAQTIGNGLYFDSMVQFTATDTAPTPTPTSDDVIGDKLIVWMREVVAGNETTYALYVTAGVKDQGVIKTTHYELTNVAGIAPGSWHRLTIAISKTVGETPTFKVYVDGVVAKSTKIYNPDGDDETITAIGEFGSLMPDGANNAGTITSVDFQGKGAIDDLVWTTEDPNAPDMTDVDVTLASETEEYEVKWVCGGEESERLEFLDGVATMSLEIGKTGTFSVLVPVGYTVKEGFEKGEEAEGFVTWTSQEYTVAVGLAPSFKITQDAPKPFTVTIGDATTTYATLADAIGAAGAATIKLTQAATLTEKVTISSKTVIDLNGYTLTENVDPGDGYDYGAFYVGTNGELTITDSSEGANGKIASNGDVVIGNYGTVTVDAGTIESANGDNTVDVSIYNFYYNGTVYGKATINGNVTSVWNSGVLTVAETATVNYLDNSGAATIAAGATVNAVVLMDGTDAADVIGAGTLRAPESLEEKVVSGVDGYNVTYKDGVYKLERDVVTVKPGQTAEVDTEEAANAVEIAVDVPAGATDEYKTYFMKRVTKNEETGKYVVTVVLDEARVKPVIEATDEDGVVKPAISFGFDGKVTINISNKLPGLFYGVKYATTVGGVKGAKAIKGLTVTPAEGATAGFFSVEVDFTDKNFETPATDAE